MSELNKLAEAFEGRKPKRPSFAKKDLEHGFHEKDSLTLLELLANDEDNDDDHDLVGMTVGVEYRDENDQLSKRWVSIVNFAKSFAGYHSIRGYCFMREDLRTFQVERIVNLFNEKGKNYDVRELFAPDEETTKPHYTSIIETHHWPLLRDGVRVLIAVARCDGYLHPKESDVIIEFAKSECKKQGYPMDGDDILQLSRFIDRQQPSGDVVANSLNRLATQEKVFQDNFMDYIQQTIYADGVLAPEEIEISVEIYRRIHA